MPNCVMTIVPRKVRDSLPTLVALVAIAGALLAACGGGEDGPAPSGTPTEAIRPSGTAIIVDNQFEYPAKGYGVEMPEGWTADADFLTGPGLVIDAFFAPDPAAGGVTANIAVTRESVEPGLTTKSYLDRKTELIRQLAREEPRISQREIGGGEATVVEYEPKTTDVDVEKTEVIFVQATYGWTITLTVPAGQSAEYEDIFRRFLESYHALDE